MFPPSLRRLIRLSILTYSTVVLLAASSPSIGQCPGSWTQVAATGLGDRYDGAMVFDSTRGTLILFGGTFDGFTPTDQTWVFDPNISIWTQVTPVISPPARLYHRMVYDSARDRVVLFGGFDGAALDDTWEYDPGANTWTGSVVAAPPPRRLFAMAYDSARGVTIIHGGQNSALSDLSDTWEWNGVEWTFRSNTGPQARAFHAMAFDQARNKTVLFGGFGSVGGVLNDTWLWNGTTWIEVALTGTRPEANFWHVMTFDSVRNRVVSTTGNQLISVDNRTYEWDGTAWRLSAIGGPSYRIASQAAFDSTRGQTVTYGGYQYGDVFLGDMWEWSGPTNNSPINFTAQPTATTVPSGSNAMFSVVATGLAPLTYQWRRNGVSLFDGGSISGATTFTLTIIGATGASAGSYDCIVTNDCGSVTSDAAALTVTSAGCTPVEQAMLTASTLTAFDKFGFSVAVSEDTAVVGAFANDDAGSAYVFVQTDATWTQQAKLIASDAAAYDTFGFSVAVSGDTAVVGALHAGSMCGSAYVVVRTGTTWTQQAELIASDAAVFDFFGRSVAISGDTTVVGAIHANADAGSAYVFTRTGTTWTQQSKLTAADAAAEDQFGTSVAVSGDTAVVAASGNDDAGSNSGSVYVFARNGAIWTQQSKLSASDAAAEDYFGTSVAVSGDTAVVGAPSDDDGGYESGSAYVFSRDDTIWTQQAKLNADDATAFHGFGESVAISGGTAIVGAYRDPDIATNAGSVYVFVRTGTTWTQQAKLTASDSAAEDFFGWSVAVSGDTAVVGNIAVISSAYAFALNCEHDELIGDMNCDNVVNIGDVPLFVEALLGGGPFSGCNINRADMNADTMIDGLDAQPFVSLLVGP